MELVILVAQFWKLINITVQYYDYSVHHKQLLEKDQVLEVGIE